MGERNSGDESVRIANAEEWAAAEAGCAGLSAEARCTPADHADADNPIERDILEARLQVSAICRCASDLRRSDSRSSGVARSRYSRARGIADAVDC